MGDRIFELQSSIRALGRTIDAVVIMGYISSISAYYADGSMRGVDVLGTSECHGTRSSWGSVSNGGHAGDSYWFKGRYTRMSAINRVGDGTHGDNILVDGWVCMDCED